MPKLPSIFEKLSSGSYEDKLRSFDYLIKSFSNEESSYEASLAANEMLSMNRIDEIIGIFVLEYSNTRSNELKVSILKVISWLFSKIWVEIVDNSEVANTTTYGFGNQSLLAIDIFIQCLYSNKLRFIMTALFMFGQQDIPLIITPKIINILQGIRALCTNNTNSANNSSTSWLQRPKESHQILLTCIMNLTYQCKLYQKETILYEHIMPIIPFIINNYITHVTNVVRVYALRLLKILFPSNSYDYYTSNLNCFQSFQLQIITHSKRILEFIWYDC